MFALRRFAPPGTWFIKLEKRLIIIVLVFIENFTRIGFLFFEELAVGGWAFRWLFLQLSAEQDSNLTDFQCFSFIDERAAFGRPKCSLFLVSKHCFNSFNGFVFSFQRFAFCCDLWECRTKKFENFFFFPDKFFTQYSITSSTFFLLIVPDFRRTQVHVY